MPVAGGQSVTIEIQDLVSMMAGEVARKVGDELRVKEIEPLHDRIDLVHSELMEHKRQSGLQHAELKEQLSNRVSWVTGAKDALLKLGWLVLALIEAKHYLGH